MARFDTVLTKVWDAMEAHNISPMIRDLDFLFYFYPSHHVTYDGEKYFKVNLTNSINFDKICKHSSELCDYLKDCGITRIACYDDSRDSNVEFKILFFYE